MKKFLTTMCALCLAVPCIFLFAGCGGNNDNTDTKTKNYASQIAGTYTNTYYVYDYPDTYNKAEATLEIKNDGSYLLTEKDIDGVMTTTTSMRGKFVINQDNSVKSMTIDNFNELMQNGIVQSFLGNVLPTEEQVYDSSSLTSNIKENMEALLKDSISFTDSYAFIGAGIGMDNEILYKNGATKLAEGTVLKVITTAEYSKAVDSIYGSSAPTYETDYYIVKNASLDLTKEDDKTGFIDTLSMSTFAYTINDLGGVSVDCLMINDVEDFDLKTVGVRTGKIKYANATETVTKSVTYTVVETDADLPENQVTKCTLVDSAGEEVEDVIAIEKNKDIYSLNLKLSYETYKGWGQSVTIIAETCEGTNSIITISGYDKSKTGYQVVSFTYGGQTCKQAFYVYDSTDNPVVAVNLSADAKVTITKTVSGTTTTYTPTVTGTLTETTIGGSEVATPVELTMEMAVNLMSDLSMYEGGDTVLFAYTKDSATFLFAVTVEVVSG